MSFKIKYCMLGLDPYHGDMADRRTSAIVGLITMVAIIGMLSWWIVPHYTTYNDSAPSYPSEMSG